MQSLFGVSKRERHYFYGRLKQKECPMHIFAAVQVKEVWSYLIKRPMIMNMMMMMMMMIMMVMMIIMKMTMTMTMTMMMTMMMMMMMMMTTMMS